MWNWNSEQILAEISYASKLYNQQQEKVSKEKHIENLLFNDYVEKIKKNTSVYDVCESTFKEAQKELNEKGRKPNLKRLENLLKEDFFGGKSIKIKSIVCCGYDNYAWSIYFDLNKKQYELQIPIMKNLTTTNISYAHYGMFCLAIEENKSFWNIIFKSYKIEELAKFISELKGE